MWWGCKVLNVLLEALTTCCHVVTPSPAAILDATGVYVANLREFVQGHRKYSNSFYPEYQTVVSIVNLRLVTKSSVLPLSYDVAAFALLHTYYYY